MSDIVIGHANSEMMEWRVLLAPRDDMPPNTDAADTIEHCVGEFRKRLNEELRRGMLPCGYGPIAKG